MRNPLNMRYIFIGVEVEVLLLMIGVQISNKLVWLSMHKSFHLGAEAKILNIS